LHLKDLEVFNHFRAIQKICDGFAS